MSRILFLTLALLSHLNIFAGDIEWKPISPAELTMKTSQVEPDADAEAIFGEVRLDDKKGGKLSYNHYVRVKIFTDRGRKKYSKFDIPFSDPAKAGVMNIKITPNESKTSLKYERNFQFGNNSYIFFQAKFYNNL